MKGVHVLSWISGVFLLVGIFGSSFGQNWHEEKYSHRMKELDAETYETLGKSRSDIDFEALLDPMLIPRLPGTPSHAAVKKFIMDHMTTLGWNVETDSFEDDTPEGRKPFTNIVSTLNPNVHRRLVLACHYDSKYMKDYDFVAATDSAVPCAMLLHLASTMQAQLNDHKNSAQNVTLQFLFFDGEEAFRYWSSTDSLYGARHLASKWEQTPYPSNNRQSTTMLHRMDMMILLDLLGTSNPKFYSFFDSTSHWHNALVQTEQQLKKSKFWSGNPRSGGMFKARQQFGGIEDDHIPFLQRGVDILHVIPSPFPTVWHTANDNREALDFPTIDNLNRIFRLFVARYLHLPSVNPSS